MNTTPSDFSADTTDRACCGPQCCVPSAPTGSATPGADHVRGAVRTTYGQVAERDLSIAQTRGHMERLGYAPEALDTLDDGVVTGLGCGNPTGLSNLRPGETVLDLGSGGGVDCLLAARQVGPEGRVIGVDMTPAMIDRAREAVRSAGLESVVDIRLGEIEALPVADASVDVVLSNCVVNLSPEKERVYREVARVLRPGGRVEISDIVALAPISEALQASMSAWAGCVAGAATVDDTVAMLLAAGLENPKVEPDTSLRDVIEGCVPGAGAAVAPARITATRPEAER